MVEPVLSLLMVKFFSVLTAVQFLPSRSLFLQAFPMKITLKNTQKVEHTVDLGPSATIGELAERAKSLFSLNAGVTLIYLGNVLNDETKLVSEVGVADGGLVIVISKKPKADTISSVATASSASVALTATPASNFAQPTTMLSLSVVKDGEVRPIEVDSDENVENIKALLEVEFDIPLALQSLYFEGKKLQNTNRLREVGVHNNDMLMLVREAAPNPISAPTLRPPASAAIGGGRAGPIGLDLFGNLLNPLQRHMREAEELLQLASVDPHLCRRIRDSNAPLAAALETRDAQAVARALAEIHRLKGENEAKKRAAIIRLNSNPLDVEAQREIEDAIRMENIDRNLDQAMEYNPESFGRVVMLYVDCEVNGHSLKAFVDSGAQSTIMSLKCAERVGLMRLVDKRYAGIARGVGTSKIVGRVHAVDMRIGTSYLAVSITVLESNDMEFLFGLDNLRRHQCILDLKDNVLRIGGEAVPFLGEGELPLHLRQENDPDPMDADPPTAPAAASSAATGVDTSDAPTAGGGAAAAVAAGDAGVEALVGMGFLREQAVAALRATGGNVELAASLLFGGD